MYSYEDQSFGKNYYFKPSCDICFQKKYKIRKVYKRLFLECDVCNLVVCRDLPYFIQDIGMGKYGMIDGEPSGGFFDHYLSKYVSTYFNSEQIVIFGAGVTLAPIQLKLLNIRFLYVMFLNKLGITGIKRDLKHLIV